MLVDGGLHALEVGQPDTATGGHKSFGGECGQGGGKEFVSPAFPGPSHWGKEVIEDDVVEGNHSPLRFHGLEHATSVNEIGPAMFFNVVIFVLVVHGENRSSKLCQSFAAHTISEFLSTIGANDIMGKHHAQQQHFGVRFECNRFVGRRRHHQYVNV